MGIKLIFLYIEQIYEFKLKLKCSENAFAHSVMSMKLIALLIDKQLQVISTVKISSRGQECNKMYYIVADFTFMANCSFNNNLIDQGHN